MTRKRLLLTPLDLLFFRDGRPFEPGTRGSGGLPQPATLLGAVRTQLWRHLKPGIFDGFESVMADCRGNAVAAARKAGIPEWAADLHVRGPWLHSSAATSRGAQACGILLPMPADLVREGRKSKTGRLLRLKPRESAPGFVSEHGLRPLWQSEVESVEQATGFVTLAGMKKWLEGAVPAEDETTRIDALACWEDRVGVGVEKESRAAEEGKLYSARFLRLLRGVEFYAEVCFAAKPDEQALDDCFAAPMAFGGESRQVHVTCDEKVIDWPGAKSEQGTICFITPGVFAGQANWRPEVTGAELVSAAVLGTTAVSGWDLAYSRPRPVKNAVNAGSVFHYRKLPAQTSAPLSLGAEEGRHAGFGIALRGSW